MDRMGQTDGVGLILYSGNRDEMQAKLRARDDRITELEAALRVVDDDVRHHLRDSYAAPGTTIPASLIRPHAIKAVRDALKKS